jgi:hypothetical protein
MIYKAIAIVLTMTALVAICLTFLLKPTGFEQQTQKSMIEQFIEDHVKIASEWKKGEVLPSFINDMTFDATYYSEIAQFGGLVDVAIVERLENKDLLLRIITGCEKELDIPFSAKIPVVNRWDVKSRLFQYYLNLNLRLVAFRRFQMEYGTVSLSESMRRLELPACSSELFYVNNVPIVSLPIRQVQVENKIVKGIIYYITKREDSGATELYSDKGDSTSRPIARNEALLKYMQDALQVSMSKHWNEIVSQKVDVQSVVDQVDQDMEKKMRGKLVSHYIGPYFELDQHGAIETRILSDAIAENKPYPFFIVKVINGYAVLIFVENIR